MSTPLLRDLSDEQIEDLMIDQLIEEAVQEAERKLRKADTVDWL